MADDWLKVEKNTADKPEILAMSELLSLHPDEIFGKCFRVWRWADSHSVDGKVPSVSIDSIDRLVSQPGFAQAMSKVGWLTVREGSVNFPNFGRHMGQSAKRRMSDVERQRTHRESIANGKPVTKNVTAKRDTVTAELRRTVYERDGNACVYCGFNKSSPASCAGEYVGATLALDHVVPWTKGGSTTTSNLVTSCSICNNRKNNRTLEEAGMATPELSRLFRDKGVTEPLPELELELELYINGDGTKKDDPAHVFEVTSVDRIAAKKSFDLWSRRARDHDLIDTENEPRKLSEFLERISQEPPVAMQNGALVPSHRLVAHAVDVLIKRSTDFKGVAFACSCVKSQIEKWRREGMGNPSKEKTNECPKPRRIVPSKPKFIES